MMDYKGIMRNATDFNDQQLQHLEEKVSEMEITHIREMIERVKTGEEQVHPQYFKMLWKKVYGQEPLI